MGSDAIVAKSCLNCEREFFWDSSTPGSQKLYCSRSCKHAAHISRALFRQRRERIRRCRHCDADISWRVGQARFCNNACYQAFEQRKQFAKHQGRRCLRCDADISVMLHKAKFCCDKCAYLYHNPHKRKRWTHCVICNRELKGKWGKWGGHVCSQKCSAKRRRQIETPEQKERKRDHDQRRYWEEQTSNLAVKKIVGRTPHYATLDRPLRIEKRSTCAVCDRPITDPRRSSYCSNDCAQTGEKKSKAIRTHRCYRERKDAHLVSKLLLGNAID